jgi:ABC-type transport system substrate-binding protein
MGRKQYAAKVVLYGRQAILADGPVPPLHPGYNACPTGNECCSPCPCTAR